MAYIRALKILLRPKFGELQYIRFMVFLKGVQLWTIEGFLHWKIAWKLINGNIAKLYASIKYKKMKIAVGNSYRICCHTASPLVTLEYSTVVGMRGVEQVRQGSECATDVFVRLMYSSLNSTVSLASLDPASK